MPRRLIHALAAILSLGVLAFGAAACGDDGGDANNAANADATPTVDPPEQVEAREPGSIEKPAEIVGGSTTVKLSPTIERVLDVAGVNVGAAGEAAESDAGLRFPIQTGELDTNTPSGRLEHSGALTFEAAGQSVEASNLVIEPKPGRVTAEVAGRRLPLLTLDMGTPNIPPTGDQIIWPATAGLTDEAAGQINDRLGVDVLSGGLKLGDVAINAEIP